MNDAVRFGKYLRNRRKFYCMSQEELADDIGVGQGTVSDWELGYTSPPIDFAQDIIARLGGCLQIVDEVK